MARFPLCHFELSPAGSNYAKHKLVASGVVAVVLIALACSQRFDCLQARLPKGIKNIRPHIDDVDNVPLLVSLFTDCTPDSMFTSLLFSSVEFRQLSCYCINSQTTYTVKCGQ